MSGSRKGWKFGLLFLLGFWLTPWVAQAQPPDGVRGGVRQAPYDVMAAAVDESPSPAGEDTYLIGMGIYDITGPAAELGMMGYAMLDQKTAGLHTRLWSRALLIATPATGKRVALVVADLAMISQAVKQKVVARLKHTFGDLYGDENVLLSATHTHAGPGGYSHYTLYNLTILGFDEQNFEAIVNGIFQSIVRAHGNLAEGRIRIARGDLLDASINRSPKAYGENPAAERVQYEFDTDKTMTLLRLERLDGTAIGTVNWFAVHGTSMGNENLLISGDNKGYAAYLFEKLAGTDPLAPDFLLLSVGAFFFLSFLKSQKLSTRFPLQNIP